MHSSPEYQRLVGRGEAAERLWDRLLDEVLSGERRAADIDEQLEAERKSWERP